MHASTNSIKRHIAAWSVVTLMAALSSVAISQQEEKNAPLIPELNPNMGFWVVLADENLALDLNIDVKQIVITAVIEGSEADTAGLLPGDIIIASKEWGELWSKPDQEGIVPIRRNGNDKSVTLHTKKHTFKSMKLIPAVERRAKAVKTIVDSSGGGDFRTLTAALLSAAPGDTVIVREGLYRESALLGAGMTIEAERAGTAIIASKAPLRGISANGLIIRGLFLHGEGGNAISLWDSGGVSIQDCEILAEENNGIFLSNCTGIIVENCNFQGGEKSTGLYASNSELTAEENTISDSAKAFSLIGGTKAWLNKNLMQANQMGVVASDTHLFATANTSTGKGSGSGFHLTNCKVDLDDNTVRQHYAGVSVTSVDGLFMDNLLGQNKIGMMIKPSRLIVFNNLLQNNQYNGILADIPKEEASGNNTISVTESEIIVRNNTIARNGGSGIYILDAQAKIFSNVVEGNGWGVSVMKGTVEVKNNTIILQTQTGISINPEAKAIISNNIIAFNKFGIEADAETGYMGKWNNVFGNLARKSFPLLDGNYCRRDKVTFTNKDKLHVRIFPAYDLKKEGDLSVDPLFVKSGEDYRLQAKSPLAVAEIPEIGAFPYRGEAATRKFKNNLEALFGEWTGEWKNPEGHVYNAKLKLSVRDDLRLDGQIEWVLKRSPRENEQTKIGQGGIEYIKGVFVPEERRVALIGYRKEDPKNVLGLDLYKLSLSVNGQLLKGVTWHHGKWNADFALHRR